MSDSTIDATDSGFSINGAMTFATVDRLLAASCSPNFKGKPVFEIDLGHVRRADSAGLALVVEWIAAAKRRNTEIRFLNMPKQMREIALMTEVDRLLPLAD